MLNDYDVAARDFLRATGTGLVVNYSHTGKHFQNDTQKRHIYSITITTSLHAFMFPYGDSIANTQKNRERCTWQKPTAYDILACLTKYEPEETLNEFAHAYGYTDNPEEAIRVYNAVKEEWANVSKLWTPEQLEALREIN